MIDTLVTALLLGLVAGAAPGIYTTVVASTALERGFGPALRLAFVPVVTETPAMVVTVVLLRQLNHEVLTIVGVGGGVVLAALGVRLFLRQGAGRETEGTEQGDFWHLAVAGLLSPVPWIFWLVAAGPLLLRSWNEGWIHALVFLLILYGMFIGTATAIAWAASRGRGLLSDRVRRRVLRGAGVVLVVAGGVLSWQSWEGNFQAMVRQQEDLRERIDDAGRL